MDLEAAPGTAALECLVQLVTCSEVPGTAGGTAPNWIFRQAQWGCGRAPVPKSQKNSDGMDLVPLAQCSKHGQAHGLMGLLKACLAALCGSPGMAQPCPVLLPLAPCPDCAHFKAALLQPAGIAGDAQMPCAGGAPMLALSTALSLSLVLAEHCWAVAQGTFGSQESGSGALVISHILSFSSSCADGAAGSSAWGQLPLNLGRQANGGLGFVISGIMGIS